VPAYGDRALLIADPDPEHVVFSVAAAAYAEPHRSSFPFDDLRQTVHPSRGDFMSYPQFVFANLHHRAGQNVTAGDKGGRMPN
jgi:hypothetical protein